MILFPISGVLHALEYVPRGGHVKRIQKNSDMGYLHVGGISDQEGCS